MPPLPGGPPAAIPGLGDIPGLGEIMAWAAVLDMDIASTLEKVWQLTEIDSTAIWDGSDQLGGVAGDLLDTQQRELSQAGTDAAAGLSGLTAEAFGQFQAGVVDQVAGAGAAARQLAGTLGELARYFAESKAVVLNLTGATAAALGMLRS